MIPTFNTLLAYKPLDNVVPVYTPVILIVDIHYPNKIKYPFSVFIELPF